MGFSEIKAGDLLEKYLKSVYEASNLTWNDKNNQEVRQIVKLIIEATKENLKTQQEIDSIQSGNLG